MPAPLLSGVSLSCCKAKTATAEDKKLRLFSQSGIVCMAQNGFASNCWGQIENAFREEAEFPRPLNSARGNPLPPQTRLQFQEQQQPQKQ